MYCGYFLLWRAGSYFDPTDQNATVAPWVRPVGLTENPPVGMRALCFVHASTRRAVIAFRGTDLNQSSASGQADACGDALLWDGASALPASCHQFSNATLDYYGAAQSFVHKARTALPGYSLLFTGHSLGAGLSFLAAATSSSTSSSASGSASASTSATRITDGPPRPAGETVATAVAFSSPAWVPVLARKAPQTVLPSAAVMSSHWLALADEWDPVQRESVAAAGLRGTQCLWASPEPLACKLCYLGKAAINISRPSCRLCFGERHVYAHYLHTDVPGDRPRCAPLGLRHAAGS